MRLGIRCYLREGTTLVSNNLSNHPQLRRTMYFNEFVFQLNSSFSSTVPPVPPSVSADV